MDSETLERVMLRLSALERRVNALFRVGKVHTVQLDPYRVRLDIGPDGEEVVTDLLPVLVHAAGAVRIWSPVAVGERCAMVSPGGEDFAAFVLPALYSTDFGAPFGDAAKWAVKVGDAELTLEADGMTLVAGGRTMTWGTA